MISKVIPPGKSFAGACRYLCANRGRAEVILSEGVRDYDHKLMALDFEEQRQFNPGLKSPVQHIILSYYPGEKISNEKMAEIAQEYLEKLGIKNTQYVVVKHNDKDHLHTHILFNRVDNDGRTIKDNWLGLRGKKMAQELTQRHDLIPALKKDLKLTHVQNLNNYEATRYEIFQTVTEILPLCKNLEDLKDRLERQKIEMIYKYKSQTQEVQGLSFKKGEFKYKGSEIDRQLSYGNLLKQIALQQVQKLKMPGRQSREQKHDLEKHFSHHSSLLEALMKVERDNEQTPYELLEKKRKRKQNGLSI
ncbi:MAG: relaxase/mobilization nuclease domain-containing protein [Sediminibacterium sp.]